MQLEDNILKDLKELWPDNWEAVVKYCEDKETSCLDLPDKVRNKLKFGKELLLERIQGRRDLIARENEILNNIIPKEQLEDGVIYLPLEGTEHFCRYVAEARWDAKEQVFWYTRTKFNFTFEDRMDHFADVVHGSIAGFTPNKKKG